MSEETAVDNKKVKKRIPTIVWVLLAVAIWFVMFYWLTDKSETESKGNEAALSGSVQQESASVAQPEVNTPAEQSVEVEKTEVPVSETSEQQSVPAEAVQPVPSEAAVTEAVVEEKKELAPVPDEVMEQIKKLFAPEAG